MKIMSEGRLEPKTVPKLSKPRRWFKDYLQNLFGVTMIYLIVIAVDFVYQRLNAFGFQYVLAFLVLMAAYISIYEGRK
jgi:hypothetical protein